MSGVFSRGPRLWVTGGYALIVAVVGSVMLRMDPDAQDALILRASTNLHNLSHGRLGTLIGSAFVVDAGPVYLWLPGLICLLGVAELLWGSRRLLLTFAVGHVGATLAVAAGLVAGVTFGWLSHEIARAADVGMSYGALAVLGSLTAALPPRWRAAWLGCWLTVAGAVLAGGGGFTDVGHVLSLLLGTALSVRFTPRPQWSAARVGMLVGGAGFGYLMLCDGVVSLVFGVAWAALGALTFASFARLRAPVSLRPT